MKYPQTRLAYLLLGAMAAGSLCPSYAQTARSRETVVITPPAVQSGSNWSRAPFPSSRQFDDVKSPDGQAIDELPPNTPATNPEPEAPPAVVAVLQPTTPTTEPVLSMTGRPTVAIAASLDAPRFTPTIRSSMASSRDQVIADVEARLSASESSLNSLRGTARDMNAESRTQFEAAADEVKESAKALRKSIKAARKAGANEWESARNQLAADYEAYASALARVDAAAGLPAVR